jgi:hypothetical protein
MIVIYVTKFDILHPTTNTTSRIITTTTITTITGAVYDSDGAELYRLGVAGCFDGVRSHEAPHQHLAVPGQSLQYSTNSFFSTKRHQRRFTLGLYCALTVERANLHCWTPYLDV